MENGRKSTHVLQKPVDMQQARSTEAPKSAANNLARSLTAWGLFLRAVAAIHSCVVQVLLSFGPVYLHALVTSGRSRFGRLGAGFGGDLDDTWSETIDETADVGGSWSVMFRILLFQRR
jgi:hypothetical protein